MAEEKKEKAAQKLGGKSKKKHGRVKSMHIHKATGGGFISHSDMEPDENGPQMPSQEHIHPDLEALKQHIADHFQDHPAMGQAPEEPEQAPAPAPSMGV